MKTNIRLSFLFIVMLFMGCKKEIVDKPIKTEAFISTMQKHLDAVTNRDSATLKGTLSPKGNMLLILPQTEMTTTVEDFMTYHNDWFAIDYTWSFETKILETKIGRDYGMAIVEIVYREPERDGEPYFNRMHVSYVLERIDQDWYIIKDHASSIEKSTDKKNQQ